MSEKYNIPEPNSLDSMEGFDMKDGEKPRISPEREKRRREAFEYIQKNFYEKQDEYSENLRRYNSSEVDSLLKHKIAKKIRDLGIINIRLKGNLEKGGKIYNTTLELFANYEIANVLRILESLVYIIDRKDVEVSEKDLKELVYTAIFHYLHNCSQGFEQFYNKDQIVSEPKETQELIISLLKLNAEAREVSGQYNHAPFLYSDLYDITGDVSYKLKSEETEKRGEEYGGSLNMDSRAYNSPDSAEKIIELIKEVLRKNSKHPIRDFDLVATFENSILSK